MVTKTKIIMKKKMIENGHTTEIHNQIIGWTNNCDTKTSILLALIGGLVTILCTSDFVANTLITIGTSCFEYWKQDSPCIGGVDWWGLITIVLFVGAIVLVGFTLWNQLEALIGRCKIDDANKNSVIFFQSIGEYDCADYIQTVKAMEQASFIDDQLSQIHICAKICSKKFEYYNRSLCFLRWGCICIGLFFISALIYNM